jgi:uncharacterized protein involved in outer membrane biogenesis
MAQRRFPRWLAVVGALVLVVVLVVAFWNWDWFVPLVDRQASAALGRKVTVDHLHVRLGRVTHVAVDNVQVANPDGFPADSRFAVIDTLAADLDVMAYIRDRAIRIPTIEVTHPVVAVASDAEGKPNYLFNTGSSSDSSSSSGPSPQIGDLRITDGHATVKLPKFKTDMAADIATTEAQGDKPAQITADAKGTYSGQPITGRFVGGALLTLRDASSPYPIDLRLANGQTRVTLVGTVQDPLHFKGTDVKLDLAGADMGQLFPLTGVPIPQTPPYEIKGDLNYAAGRIRFEHFAGRVGHSDLEGDIAVDPGKERQQVEANLSSRVVDLDDLAGFIGSTPGKGDAVQTPEQKREHAKAEADPHLLPNTPINFPKVRAADVKLKYRGAKIEGRSMPLDNLVANMTIDDGRITLTPLSFGVGKGAISADIDLAPQPRDQVRAKVDISFKQVDIGRLMAATHTFGGAGTIGGRAVLDSTGNSIATLLGHGNGDIKLFATGGDLSALLVALSGLQFGNAVISALGLPTRTELRCLIADLPLEHGVLDTRILLVDTDQSNVHGSGTIDLSRELLNYQLKTEAKHFSIGSLPAPIDIRGTLKSPSILPDPATVAARGGAAIALGALLTPLGALIPTIQLGLGENNDCSGLIASVGREGTNKLTPAQIRASEGKK